MSRMRIQRVRLRAKRIENRAIEIMEMLTAVMFAAVGGAGRVW